MAVTAAKITIVGCGPGDPDYATVAARRAIRQADVLAGSNRLMQSFPGDGRERVVLDADIERTLTRLAGFLAAGRGIVLLVSGDPGLFSLARNVIGRFGRERCAILPGISSVQVAFARLGLDWADARIVSAHGRSPGITAAELAAYDKVAILAGTADAMRWSADLATKLAETHAAFLCENLTLPNESVRGMTAAELSTAQVSSLAIVVLVRKELV